MIPEGYKSPEPAKWSGEERRKALDEHHTGQLHAAITKMEVMTSRFEALDKQLATFMADIKESQANINHQARQDYEYLDTKIEKKCGEATETARAALKKVEDHILLTQQAEATKKTAGEWARWVPSIIFGLVGAIITIANFWRQ